MDRTTKASRAILDAWYLAHPYCLTQHHVQSYDHFVEERLRASILAMNHGFSMTKKVSADHGGHFEVNVFVGGRQGTAIYMDKGLLASGLLMYPNDARLQNANYVSHLYADVLVEYRRNSVVTSSREFLRMRIGAIPIMVHSSICVLRGQAPSVLRDMGECPFDQGGYFIIGGKEKIIIAQERIAYNRLFVTPVNPRTPEGKLYSHDAFIRCLPPTDLFPRLLRFKVFAKKHKRADAITISLPHVQGTLPLFVLFRCLGVESDEDILRLILGGGDVSEERVKQEDAQIVDFLRASVIDANATYTQPKAFELFGQRSESKGKNNSNNKQVKSLLINNVLPNVGHDFEDKAVYLGYLVNRVVRVCIGVLPATVRDSWVHKRMDLSGYLLSDLFRDVYRRFRLDAMIKMDQEFTTGPWKHSGDFEQMINASNFSRIFDATVIERGIIRSFKGQWNYDEKNPDASKAYAREGVVQDLNRQSYMTYMSHVRRVSTVMGTKVKLVAPHLIYAAQWGAVCPVDSPDGANVGLLKHFTVLCHVTADRDPAPLADHLIRTGIVTKKDATLEKRTRVFLNHSLIGVTSRPAELTTYVRLLRRTGLAAADVSVTWDVFGWEINCLTDGGRTCRPLLTLPHKATKTLSHAHASTKDRKWMRLISGDLLADDDLLGEFFSPSSVVSPQLLAEHGARSLEDLDESIQRLAAKAAPIELIDSEELNSVLVATARETPGPRHTHSEIHSAAAMFSPLTATLPMLDHNPAAYNSLCVAQTKQGIGLYASSFNARADVSGMVLHSPQMPLVTSYFADKLCNGQLAHGENLIVAICTYTGYNQEDALIVNRSSVERGMLNLSSFATLSFQEETSWDGLSRVVIANPAELVARGSTDLSSGGRPVDHGTLDADGLPIVGTRIEEGDAILGMCSYAPSLEDPQQKEVARDATHVADKTVWGTVDRVYVTDGAVGSRTCKIRLREVRAPDLGDKLASRYGQKGVVGLLVPQADMPFSAGGIVPDVIINPNGFPKRMTVGHLLEAILGRVACHKGTRLDATSFEGTDPAGAAKAYFMSRKAEEWTSTTGDTVLYNGRTGQQMETQVFVGVNYYSRLKHMSIDKINYRSDQGPRNVLTRQPTHGRGNGGGLKMGEMEQHCMLSHGASSFLKESFFDRSDGFEVRIDERTGLRAEHGSQLSAGVSAALKVPMPYSFKQMSQEVESMLSIGMRVHF